jgi:hypothetical protein
VRHGCASFLAGNGSYGCDANVDCRATVETIRRMVSFPVERT